MRIGINIPNELHRRMEPLKETMNVSQLCRDAITNHLEKYENAIANLEDYATKIALEQVCTEELRRRSILYVDWEMLGYEDAIAWVKAAESEDWSDWRGIQDVLKRQKRPAWDIQPRLRSKIKRFDDRWHGFRELIDSQSDEFLDWLYGNNLETDWDAAKRDYGRAWLSYVNAAWQQIRQRREEYSEALRLEGLEKRRNRPKPEVPEHILADIQQGR